MIESQIAVIQDLFGEPKFRELEPARRIAAEHGRLATCGLSRYACGASVSDNPRNTKIARLSPFSSSEFNVPTSLPSRFRGTAVSLSTINLHGARRPVRVLDGIGSLKVGADVGSVVKGHTTTESFASNRSS